MEPNIINLSAESLWKLHLWIPHDLKAETIVFLPDACPGKAPLPTGTAVLTRQTDWRKFAVSDCGCGMRLLRSNVQRNDLTPPRWDELANRLRANKGKLGDLGGGNHFLDALAPLSTDQVFFLIHTGSRSEAGLVDAYVDQPKRFDQEFDRVVQWASQNRASIHSEIEDVFDKTECVIDRPHNSYQALSDGRVIIRKGAVRVDPGDLVVLPSHISGDVALLRATERVAEILHSLSHGTGRTMSRGDSKALADGFDFATLREKVIMPSALDDASLRSEGPYAYRDLDECLALVSDYVEVVDRFEVIAHMGHL